jgi:hypothetical protein
MTLTTYNQIPKTMDIYDHYWKFVESERHFNGIQADIRKLASAWILASFAAIALLLKSDPNVKWLVSPSVLVGVISLMSSLGLMVLWINDQLVYQRLLDCGFATALKMEYDHPELPPVRILMMSSAKKKGMSNWMTYFYTIPMWVYLAITMAALILRHSIEGGNHGLNDNQSLLILVIIIVFQLASTIWVHCKKSSVGTKNRIHLFGNNEFVSLFDGTPASRARLAEIIRNRTGSPYPIQK